MNKKLEIIMDSVDARVPEIRRHECTFVTMRVEGWGEHNQFRLWWPEHVDPLWNSGGPPPTTQAYGRRDGGLAWDIAGEAGKAWFTVVPQGNQVLLEATIRNTGSQPFTTCPAACFQTWNARDFYSHDLSRIWAEIEGKWRRLSETDLAQREYLPHGGYLREGYDPSQAPRSAAKQKPKRKSADRVMSQMEQTEAGRARLKSLRQAAQDQVQTDPRYSWITDHGFREFVVYCQIRLAICREQGLSQMYTSGHREKVTHPLICAIADDGRRAAGIAAAEWVGHFHNNDPWIGCLHSTPAPKQIQPGNDECFKARLLFGEDGLEELLRSFDATQRIEQALTGASEGDVD